MTASIKINRAPVLTLWAAVVAERNDGYFLVFVDLHYQWGNMPANYHNGACGFSFADGHAEIRKWLDPDTLSKQLVANPKGPRDVPWIQVRTTAPINAAKPWPP
jgi:prepilin-type processing-associated H-X9-DG protein